MCFSVTKESGVVKTLVHEIRVSNVLYEVIFYVQLLICLKNRKNNILT